MSWDALVWARGVRGVHPVARLLLLELAFSADEVANVARVKRSVLAEMIERSERNVTKYLAQLEDVDLIERVPLPGRNMVVRLIVEPPDDEKLSPEKATYPQEPLSSRTGGGRPAGQGSKLTLVQPDRGGASSRTGGGVQPDNPPRERLFKKRKKEGAEPVDNFSRRCASADAFLTEHGVGD